MGKLRQRGRNHGYILLDVLVALFIILVGFSVFLEGMSLAGRTAAKRNERVLRIIEERNSRAVDQTVLFGAE